MIDDKHFPVNTDMLLYYNEINSYIVIIKF